jgi:hypothetical protein
MNTALIDPKRPNWTIPPAPGAQPAPPGAAQRLRGGASTVGRAARAAGPAAVDTSLAAAGGAAAAGVLNQVRQRRLDSAPAFEAPPTAPGQIPGADPRYQAPPAAAGSFLNQSEAGRNLGNIANATVGLRVPAGAFTRASAAAPSIAPVVQRAPTAVAAARGFAAGDAAMPGTPGARPAPTMTAATDYSNEGRNYPDSSSAMALRTPDLTGKIVRNGNSYSGTDVKFGADIVNPDGSVRTPRGSVTSLPTGEGYQSDLRELGRLRAERAEREAGFAANQPGGGLTGMSTRSLVDDLVAKNKPGQMEQELRGMSPRQRAETLRTMATLDQRGAEAQMSNAAALRGQDISAATSRYGVDAGSTTARRGQDMDYAEKIDARRMDLAAKQAERLRIAEAWKGTADPAVAARRLAASGMDPSKAIAVASDARAATEATGKDVDRTVESLSTTVDKNGAAQISPGAVAQNRALLTNIAPGYTTASPEVRRQQQPLIFGSMQAVNGMNALRGDNTLDQLFGRQPDAMTSMPDVSGAEISQLGYTDVLPWSKRSVGDTRLRLRDGSEQYIPRALMDENTRAALKANGARLAKE